jgi:transposase-like protein
VVHPNAPLSPQGRLRVVRLICDDGWPVARAAERFQISRTTAYRWLGRNQQAGRAGLIDRPSRPHRMPRLTPAPVVRKVVHLRTTRRWGPVQIGARLGLAPLHRPSRPGPCRPQPAGLDRPGHWAASAPL